MSGLKALTDDVYVRGLEAINPLGHQGAVDIGASAHHSICLRTTLSLDPDVYEAAKALAQSSGRTMGQVVSELLRKAIKGTPEPPTSKRGAVPVFRVSDKARIIPSSRAAELMAEEGVE